MPHVDGPAQAGAGLNPAAWIAAAFDHLVTAEPWARQALAAHAGKAVRFVSAPFVLTFAILENGRIAAASSDTAPAVSLDVPIAAVPQLAFAALNGDMQTAALRHTTVTGDAELAQLISRLTQSLRWDAEEDLSRVIGDAPAHGVFTGLNRLHAQMRDIAYRAATGARDYLVIEQPTLIDRHEAEQFSAEVRRLREGLDRLDKRLVRLSARTGA